MKKILNFIFETGNLKNIKRSGWANINVKNPETIAEHSFRCAIIGYLLSKMENVNTEKVVIMCLFHDTGETRIGDFNALTKKYLKNYKKIEESVLMDQIKDLEEKELIALIREYVNGKTKESVVAKDADALECAIQAKEYMDIGHKRAKIWIDTVKKNVKTESAKKILSLLEKSDSNFWWKDLLK
jgi:putative hydrolase of HD superfamily